MGQCNKCYPTYSITRRQWVIPLAVIITQAIQVWNWFSLTIDGLPDTAMLGAITKVICSMIDLYEIYHIVHSSYLEVTQIARFVWPTWGPPGAARTQVGPRWPHESCYQLSFIQQLMNYTHNSYGRARDRAGLNNSACPIAWSNKAFYVSIKNSVCRVFSRGQL